MNNESVGHRVPSFPLSLMVIFTHQNFERARQYDGNKFERFFSLALVSLSVAFHQKCGCQIQGALISYSVCRAHVLRAFPIVSPVWSEKKQEARRRQMGKGGGETKIFCCRSLKIGQSTVTATLTQHVSAITFFFFSPSLKTYHFLLETFLFFLLEKEKKQSRI